MTHMDTILCLFGSQHAHYSVDPEHNSDATRPFYHYNNFGDLNHTQEAHARVHAHTLHHTTPVPAYTKMGTYEVMQAGIG